MAGCLVLVGQISDAVITPIIGVVCDRQNCTPNSWFLLRAGKRKFWHIIGTALLLIAFPLSYTYPLLLEDDGAILKKFSIHTIVYVLIIALFQGKKTSFTDAYKHFIICVNDKIFHLFYSINRCLG